MAHKQALSEEEKAIGRLDPPVRGAQRRRPHLDTTFMDGK